VHTTQNNSAEEGKRSGLCSPLVLQLYARLQGERPRSLLRRWVTNREGGPAYSLTIREIFRQFHCVNVGLYTATPCTIRPEVFHRGTSIGRYSSISETVRTFTRNHTTSTRSTHGFFDNPALGKVKTDLIPWGNLVIGNGVWIGHNAILLPPTHQIGDGAVITAGSVVCSNVPPYAIVSGFPARVVGYRFGEATIAKLLASRWWDKTPVELSAAAEYYRSLLDGADEQSRPLASASQVLFRNGNARLPGELHANR
jgi:virginiamycin A acetyltransferase